MAESRLNVKQEAFLHQIAHDTKWRADGWVASSRWHASVLAALQRRGLIEIRLTSTEFHGFKWSMVRLTETGNALVGEPRRG